MAGGGRIRGPLALKIIGKVFLTLGLAGLVAAAGFAFLELRSARSATADGIIIGFNYGPVVQFTSQDGQTAQFVSAVRSSLRQVGEHVPVAYAPDSPGDAKIDAFAGRWFLPGLFGILGGVFSFVGTALLIVGRQSRGQLAYRL
jgi:Protein of unknown function (DUF3592)